MKDSGLRVDDLVILGRSSPDRLRDNRISVCTAGYSRTLGFIRLYPTRIDSPLKVWNIVSVQVERNPMDNRAESWKIVGAKSEWDRLSNRITVMGELKRGERLSLVGSLKSDCVKDLEEQGRSLGIVKPARKECYFSDRADHDTTIQKTLFGGDTISDKHAYKLQPRVKYACTGCQLDKGHDQQILEWGVYEWMRKNPGKEGQVWENLFWKEDQQEVYFLVGNQARRPSSFMVVSFLRIAKPKGPLSRIQSPASSTR